MPFPVIARNEAIHVFSACFASAMAMRAACCLT
jgi:hypothetical protein